jgi:putative sigma-54 modulation protein
MEPQIIKENYSLKPMFIDEAVMQLNTNEQQFIVFKNVENEKVSVLFRKASGNYGLIETR